MNSKCTVGTLLDDKCHELICMQNWLNEKD